MQKLVPNFYKHLGQILTIVAFFNALSEKYMWTWNDQVLVWDLNISTTHKNSLFWYVLVNLERMIAITTEL